MRIFLTCALVCASFSLLAQNLRVIDKSPKTAIIFDESDSHSYISLLKESYLSLGHYMKEGIAPEDLAQLTPEERSNLIKFVGEFSDIPLIDEDPTSPNFGETMIEEGEDGMFYVVYPPPDTLHIDLNGISRIVLDYTSKENDAGELEEWITSVTFCKMYDETYVPVLTVQGDDILHLSGFTHFEAVNAEHNAVLTAEEKGSYWKQLYDSVSYATEDYYLDLNYLPSDISMFMLERYNPKPSAYEMYDLLGGDGFQRTDGDEFLEMFPFDYFYHDSLYYKPYEEMLEYMRPHFSPMVYSIHQSDVPLIDADPDSPNFGEPLIEEGEDGTLYYVYPGPDIHFEWLGFEPELYWMGAFNDQTSELQLQYLFFVEQDENEQHLVCIHELNDYWKTLVVPTLMEFDWEAWHASYQKALKSGKDKKIHKQKHRDKLMMSDSFWKDFNNRHTPK